MEFTVPNTERLRFELLDPPANADLLLQMDSDPEVMRFIGDGKTGTLEDILNESMPRVAKYRNTRLGWGIWMVYRKDADEFLGWILVRPMGFFEGQRDDSDLELGWRFKKECWGKGYATESATHIMNRLIDNGERKFTAMAISENRASVNVMKKLGMQYLRTDALPDSDPPVDIVFYQRIVAESG